jgi:glycosyltransferase involved in cell wall biosynthesis
MRLVFVTQSIDAEDPILGATVAKLRALAERCDELVVIADRIGSHDLPPNCTFRTFGAPTRLRRGLRYLRALAPLLLRRRGERPDALVAHMCPIYLVLAAPLAKPTRVPLLLWYTHWTLDRTLRIATALADVGLSVDRRSYPIDSPKVRGIGHGIDVAQFAARAGAPPGNGELRLLALGRTSPSKNFGTLLRACARARGDGLDLRAEIRGPSSTEEERLYRRELQELIRSEGLEEVVQLHQAVPRPAVPELVRGADAVVNTTLGQTAGGALDKVVYESAACAVPVMACNPHFDELLSDLPVELRFASGDDADLARVLRAFAETDAARRDETGRELRRRVERGHSVDSWADGVVATVRSLRD